MKSPSINEITKVCSMREYLFGGSNHVKYTRYFCSLDQAQHALARLLNLQTWDNIEKDIISFEIIDSDSFSHSIPHERLEQGIDSKDYPSELSAQELKMKVNFANNSRIIKALLNERYNAEQYTQPPKPYESSENSIKCAVSWLRSVFTLEIPFNSAVINDALDKSEKQDNR